MAFVSRSRDSEFFGRYRLAARRMPLIKIVKIAVVGVPFAHIFDGFEHPRS